MATIINTLNDSIKIDQAFVSGKHRIAVNGTVIFEEKMGMGVPQRRRHGNREYIVEFRGGSPMHALFAIRLQILEGQEVIHEGLYNQAGKPVDNEEEVKRAGSLTVWILIFSGIGASGASLLVQGVQGIFPSMALGGLGGALGGLVGLGIGKLIQKEEMK